MVFVGRRVWNKNERVGRCSVVGVLAVGWLAFVSFGGVLVLRLSGAVLDGGAARRRGAGEAEAEVGAEVGAEVEEAGESEVVGDVDKLEEVETLAERDPEGVGSDEELCEADQEGGGDTARPGGGHHHQSHCHY